MKNESIQDLAMNFIESSSEKDFVKLYKRIKYGLANYCKYILEDDDDVQDAISNTMEKILTNLSQYEPQKGNFSTWLYNIAKNESLIIKKYKKVHVPIEYEDGDDNSNNENILYLEYMVNLFSSPLEKDEEEKRKEELYYQVIQKVEKLPEKYKEIFYDRHVLNMSYDAISQKYNIPVRTVATRIRRARIRMKKNISKLFNYYNDNE